MNLDYFKSAEHTLLDLPLLKKSVSILENRLERLIASGAPKDPKGIDFSKPYVDSHYSNDTLNELLAVAEVQRELDSTKHEIEEIERALMEVPSEQRKVITLFYVDKLPAEVIAERIFVESEKTVYNLRNKGISNFALLYYGALAKQSKK